MKTKIKQLCTFLSIITLAGCSSDNTEELFIPKDIKLSIESHFGWIHINGVDTEFEILDGNGDYTVLSSDEEIAKAELNGTKIMVSFIKNGSVDIIITDKMQKTAKVNLSASDNSLAPFICDLLTEKSKKSKLSLSFGAGGYVVGDIQGTSAIATIEDDFAIVEALDYGRSTIEVADKRGTKAHIEVDVIELYDMETNLFDIETKNNRTIIIKLGWGNNWSITSNESTLYKAIINSGGVQIETQNILGNGQLRLKDKDGSTATINLAIRK